MRAALQRRMRHNQKLLLGCLFIITAMTACSSRRTALSSQSGSDPLSQYIDNTTSVVSCFSSAQPTITLYQPAANAVVAGATVIFRVSMPSCNNQLQLLRDGADAVTFAQNAYFEKVYAQAGTALETVRIQHKNPVTSGASYVDISLSVTVLAANTSTPAGTPSCQVAVQPGSSVSIPTDPNLVPIAPASFLFSVTSPSPVVIRSIAVSPDPTKTQLRAPISTSPLATQYVAMDIARPFYNIVIFQVAADGNATQMADCAAIVYLEPVPVYPAPVVSVLIDGLPGPINALSVNHILTWSSTNAASCTVAKNGTATATGISGQLPVVAVSQTDTYQVVCNGPGGQATASIALTLACNPATNVLQTLANRNTIARNLPRRICQNGSCGAYPPGVFDNGPNSADVVIKTAPILSGLAAGQRIKLSGITGELMWRVRHSGAVEGFTYCANTDPAASFANMRYQFTDDAGNLIAVPGANVPSATAYTIASGAMVPMREFTGAGVVVPAGATRLWDSFADSGYWDNEFSVSDPPRVPTSRPTTNGCHYTVEVLGCM